MNSSNPSSTALDQAREAHETALLARKDLAEKVNEERQAAIDRGDLAVDLELPSWEAYTVARYVYDQTIPPLINALQDRMDQLQQENKHL